MNVLCCVTVLSELGLNLRNVNDFFKNMGNVEGKGKAGLTSYRWKLIEPRIDIEEDTILFFSKIRLSVGELKTHKNVEGWVSTFYNQETNKVQLKVEEAKVILDIDIFGNNVVLTELDIAHYFSKPFNLNGPQPMSEHVEFDLPNGDTRQPSNWTTSDAINSNIVNYTTNVPITRTESNAQYDFSINSLIIICSLLYSKNLSIDILGEITFIFRLLNFTYNFLLFFIFHEP